MNAAERFQILLVTLGVLGTGGLGAVAFLIKTLWNVASDTRANTDAVLRLDSTVTTLDRRLARVEASEGRGHRGRDRGW